MWPSLDEYEDFEDAVMCSLGLSDETMVSTNKMSTPQERYTSFRATYKDAGGPSGGPANSDEARTQLLKVLSSFDTQFLAYYGKLKRRLKQPSSTMPPSPASDVMSINALLLEMGLTGLTSKQVDIFQRACIKHIASATNSDPQARTNSISEFSSRTCTDYTVPSQNIIDVKGVIYFQCFMLIQNINGGKSSSASFPYTEKQPNSAIASTFKIPPGDGFDDDEDSDRLRIQDVVDDLADEFADVIESDDVDMNDIKMVAGGQMMRDERKRKYKRKRDEDNMRIYTEEDRGMIAKHVRSALSKARRKITPTTR